jgi:hypothetical protein
MLCRQQLRDLTDNKESELQSLFEQIERQEQLLEEIHQEKRGMLTILILIFLCAYSCNSRIGKAYWCYLQFGLFPNLPLSLVFSSFFFSET